MQTFSMGFIESVIFLVIILLKAKFVCQKSRLKWNDGRTLIANTTVFILIRRDEIYRKAFLMIPSSQFSYFNFNSILLLRKSPKSCLFTFI